MLLCHPYVPVYVQRHITPKSFAGRRIRRKFVLHLFKTFPTGSIDHEHKKVI